MTASNEQSTRISGATVDSIFHVWIYVACAVSFTILASMFLNNPWWLPLIVFVEAYFFNAYRKRLTAYSPTVRCGVLPWLVLRILIWSGIVMLLINLLYAPWFFGDSISGGLMGVKPIITSLVIFPVSVVLCLYALLRGNNLGVCKKCIRINGYYPVDGTVGWLYRRETDFQVRLMLWVSLGLGIAGYVYYGVWYINLSFSNADRYFFEILPLIIYGLTIFYLFRRYEGMKWGLRMENACQAKNARSTTLRYLVLSGDRLLLKENKEGAWDTPVKCHIERTDQLSPSRALNDFISLSTPLLGCNEDVGVKYIYSNEAFATGSNMLHYAAFVPESVSEQPAPEGCRWFTLDAIDRLIASRRITKKLGNELYRIYAVTMAWKTYDRNGRRLYPIKNYKPTFRLRDLSRWDVDYDDMRWIRIFSDNQDDSLFGIKYFLSRIFGGHY